MSQNIILQVDEVWKTFGGLVALGGVSLKLHQNEILGLIGPNGAGKTTLFNVIAGAFRPDRGTVIFKHENITGLKPNRRCHLGISRTFQIPKPFLDMSVLDNVVVGAYFGSARRIGIEAARDAAVEILNFVGLDKQKDYPAKNLTIGERKKLELCRALAAKPDVLLLDEVVGGLHSSEVKEIMEVIKRINQSGVAILMIEHVMKAVMGVSQRIVVLQYGKKLAEGTPDEIVQNEEVIAAYLGGKRDAAS
ncbi:amino acid/amide ABC transporter ATP-binding protein 1, HAAT family (TC 3.A.1.4.-) [Desulfotomaculum arcticum]|uniref:Amino acid/amide ABC transporter ATP-binding protein 1, HAAT family (TC 3.A.1.4.-) n=1 Tax=Desulfotruncus arcticus DSM 17038 TaxID=1121424 RepID=A0A1I2PK46_9FIRM|nr:ABC transporter ATP-binding protein [Desulfotruncus arcticus]SFG14367.1 amino acid/amide ABC transporter ATP-binding protein 1, HAAT family (TC 3.A.1.4.-) [Desulfotomaculum arcticum] [Desulfotruncus arcticus DSM 17038]